MPRTWIVVCAALAAVVILGSYFGSPLLAAQTLRTAAREGDADKLQQLVDFPAVREGLKGQLNAMVVNAMQSSPDLANNPFAGLAVMMAPAIVNQAVDGYVTPDGISTMLGGQQPTVGAQGGVVSMPKGSASKPSVPFTHGYKDLDTYVIEAKSDDDPATEFKFFLHRRGIFGWKLTRIELPKALLTRANSGTPVEAPPEAADDPAPAAAAAELLNTWLRQNEDCRGGSGDDPATDVACEARERTGEALTRAGWCYGENAAYGYQMEWLPCGSPKFANEAEAEEAAEQDRVAHGN